MQPLKITAYLGTKLSVSDDWSPSLDALLIKLLLDELGLASSNPMPEDIVRNQPIIDAHMPIFKGQLKGEWYWQTSSPCYLWDSDSTETIHKRWDQQERNLDWQSKRRNWSTSETNTKAWTILIPERSTPQIDWYCVGDADEITRLLTLCDGLAKKRRTQVTEWVVEAIEEDWHLWRNGDLMRPMPCSLMDKAPMDFAIRQWAWRPPTHLPENTTKCLMPVKTVHQVKSVYAWDVG
jgi:CRISPR type IV-associated protein Csf3